MSINIYSEGVYKSSDSLDFLKNVWSYTSLEAQCFCIVIVENSKLVFKHFCLNDYGEYSKLLKAVRKYINSVRDIGGKHIYFQVLPLSAKPREGRGTAKDVSVGGWLWADLDYKEVVDKPGFEGCRELEDYALECYYTDRGKVIHVVRPPLKRVLEDVKTKLGLEPYYVVDSGAGYHLYFKLMYEVDASRLRRLEEYIVDLLGGDQQSKDLARILRLPGSVNPRVARLVKVIYQGSTEVDPSDLEQRLATKPKPSSIQKMRELRELSDSDILRITELIKDSYRPGYRQFLLLYLSGWMAKAGVSPITAVKIAKQLYESTQDADPLKTRLSAVIYSYRKAGVNVDEYASEIEFLCGIKPYGLEREIDESKVKGVTGLQEILETTLGEDRALAVIHELSEVLESISPFKDSVIELVDYERQIYAVANLRKLVIARARRDNNKFIYKERVAIACPTKVVVYVNPIGGVTKYEVLLEGSTLTKPLTIGPATVDEIADRLALEGLVYHRKLITDVLSAIIQAFIRKGRAEVKTEIESPGFYLINDRLTSVKTINYQEMDVGKLKEALLLLNELANVWFKHVQEKFSTIIKWGAVAPFNYVFKQRGKWMHWLYLYGDSATGKTTLGRIVLRLWGLTGVNEKTGSSIDTVPRIGYVLSMSTYPILINEPGNALSKEDVVEAIKNAIDTTLVRGKYVKTSYIEIPALSPLIFTSNKFMPQDDALVRRLRIITFSFGEKIPLDRQKEFKEKVEPRLSLLSEIGKCITKIVIEGGLPDSVDYMELGKALLGKCYENAGLPVPEWLGLEYAESVDIHSSIVEEFGERLKKYINDSFARYVSRIVEIDAERAKYTTLSVDTVTLEQKLRILLEKNLLAGFRVLEGGNVAITSSLLREIGLEGRISLKSLSEIMGWEYKPVRVKAVKEVIKASVTSIDSLVKLLSP
ncbi:MAG: hypothetical protein QW164_04195 [Desulfurococcaceae archaeon]